jgi:cytochrome c556
MIAMLVARFYRTILVVTIFASMSLTSQQGQQKAGTSAMPGMESSATPHGCDDLSSMGGMSVMGESMGAMTNHMCITPLRARQPGDEEKVKALVAQVRAAIEKYKDYKKALADGYVIANPKVVQPQYHFTNDANVRLADTMFDPTKPSSLLYYHTETQRYKLEGVMYTDRPGATEEELNQRIPLSIVRWHEHTNFCGAPADKVKEYFGDHPKFGMFGSIHTKEACQAEGGTFMPVIFTWMIHMFPFEDNLKDVFSMNDDVIHVQ